ncbi:MAG TPA: hypothetical protein PLE30_00220 [Candidatus Kapabacteria bacterium]|nr:hypothetical protein [Candidatus Kapabacteria bacterium]
MNEDINIPFYNDNIYGGFAETKGLIYFENNFLIFEFETKDALLQVVSSGVKIIKIPLDGIRSVEFKKGFFSSKLIITAKSLKYFANVPGNESNVLTYKIKKQHNDLVRLAVSHLQLLIAENTLKKFE